MIYFNIFPWELILILLFTWIGVERGVTTSTILTCAPNYAAGFPEFEIFHRLFDKIEPAPFLNSTVMGFYTIPVTYFFFLCTIGNLLYIFYFIGIIIFQNQMRK